jgi:DHA2 family multidrug resistance protein
VGLFSLLRNEGGSVGTSMAQTFQERRDQFHTLRVGEYLDPFNPDVSAYLARAQAAFFQQTGDSALSQQMALASLEELRAQQAGSLAYFDIFAAAAALSAGLVLLVFFMKRSVAEKGAHMAAE